MKTKRFLLPSIFLALMIVAYIAATLIFCRTTKPEIREGEFPFSITYEYKGETKTLSGVYKCEFSGTDTIRNEHNRYWNGESIIECDGEYDIPNIVYNDEKMTLSVHEFMEAGYFMGDPLYKDWYSEHYGYDGPHPHVEYYDYVNDISLTDENREEIFEAIDFKIIDSTYPEPIENSFSFSGISYEADNIVIFVAISLAFLLLCLIFVRKDKEYKYTGFDKLGIGFNFLLGIVALPYIAVVCMLFGIVESNVEIIDQIIYNIPPISILCLALSIVLRRKGLRKTGFFVQFGGVFLFAIVLLIEFILEYFVY